MTSAFEDVLAGLRAQRAELDGQMQAVECLEAAREKLAGLGFEAGVTAKDGRLRLEVRLEPVRALPAPEDDPGPAPALEPEPKPEPAPEPCRPDEYVTGPFSDEEKALMVDIAASGAEAGEIAARLGRRTGPVAMALRQMPGRIAEAKGEVADPPAPEAPVDVSATLQSSPLSVSERYIDAHLNALGYAADWTAARDLALAQALARGDKLDVAAAALKVARDEARGRWRALNTDPGDLDHQARLLRVLQHRAERAA